MYLPTSLFFVLLMASLTSSSSYSVPLESNKHFRQHSNQLQQDSRIAELQQKVKYPTLHVQTAEDNSVIGNGTDSLKNDASESRTFFGLRKRLKMAIPIIMYKLGVATTMLGVLTLLSAKSVLIGLIILIIQLTTGLAKIFALKKEHNQEHHPEPTKWEEDSPHKPPQNIHVHVHGGGQTGGHYKTVYSHSPWSKTDRLSNRISGDMNNRVPNGYGSRISDYMNTRIAENMNSRVPDGYGSRISDYLNSRLEESLSSRIDEDYYQRLKELKELQDLRDSLYSQVI